MSLTAAVTLATIRRALTRPLPGLPAQMHMSPPYRPGIVPREIVNPNNGGVLILLYPNVGELKFVLMRSADHDLDRHSGQISLPGGRYEIVELNRRAHVRVAMHPDWRRVRCGIDL